MENSTSKWIVFSIVGVIGLLLLIWLWPFGTIDAGNRGVLLQFGAATGSVKGEGLYFRVPVSQRVVKMNVQVQKEQVEANAASKDLQTVTANVALNYHLDSDKVVEIYKRVGVDYKIKLIDPSLQESVKAITANYSAEELITKREQVTDAIRTQLKDKLTPQGLYVDGFNVVNFDFSKSFNAAIENKVTAEQNALAAKNKLDQVKYEAEQRVAEAEGEAKAIAIQSQAIQQNGGSAYINLKAIEKWNGSLPQYQLGGTTPFINITPK